MKSVTTLSAAIGERIRSLREEAGKTQSDLAKAGRDIGLGWTRSGVASIETGRRNLSIEDLLLLPLVLYRAHITEEETSLSDLLPADEIDVALAKDFSIRSKHLRMSMAGEIGTMTFEGMNTPHGRAVKELAEVVTSPGFRKGVKAIRDRTVKLWPGARFSQVIAAERDQDGEAEQKAARRFQAAGLKVGTRDVSIAAHRLWGMGLTAKRDELAPETDDRRALTAARGHVTRKLLKEIEPIIKEVG